MNGRSGNEGLEGVLWCAFKGKIPLLGTSPTPSLQVPGKKQDPKLLPKCPSTDVALWSSHCLSHGEFTPKHF